jgi:hypothetical protein
MLFKEISINLNQNPWTTEKKDVGTYFKSVGAVTDCLSKSNAVLEISVKLHFL